MGRTMRSFALLKRRDAGGRVEMLWESELGRGQVAVDAVKAAMHPHSFLSVSSQAQDTHTRARALKVHLRVRVAATHNRTRESRPL